MKPFIIVAFLFIAFTSLQAQNKTKTDAIVAEGKALYRSEMASWYGTDVFLEKFKDQQSKIGGYFSYVTSNTAHCVFFSRDEEPRILAVITFDSSYNVETAQVDDTRREFLPVEQELYTIRKKAYEVILQDSMFKTYKNSRLNLVPMINGKDKKVYVLTGTSQHNVVIFGNDYLLTFDAGNNLTTKKALHRNIIPVEYGKTDGEEFGAIHSHQPETGEYITATDICTLMLYAKLTKWKQHIVISDKYVSIWNCETNELTTLTTKAWKKIAQD